MTSEKEEITVVIISHRSEKKIIKFIKNFSKKRQIIIIDNSNDLNLKKKLQNYTNIKLFFMPNKGYGAAINFARQKIDTRFFFVFSPDIIGVDENFINKFDEQINTNIKFGAMGPRFKNVKEKSHKQSDVNKKLGEIYSISGSAILLDKETFDHIGAFDENFFLFFEESDFCKRAKKKQFKIYQLNNAIVEHPKNDSDGVVSTDSPEQRKELKNFYSWHFMWSKYYFLKKHYNWLIVFLYTASTYLRILTRVVFCVITRNEDKTKKYKSRFDGFISSVNKKKSYKRLAVKDRN